MNATPLFKTMKYATDPTPYFEMWNDIPEQIFVEFSELIFQDPPSEYFRTRFEFHEDRAYPSDPKRLDWVLELAIALESFHTTTERYERTRAQYELWKVERAMNSIKISPDRV